MTASRWWVMGEFPNEHELLEAVGVFRSAGFGGLDAHSPIPIEGMSEALGLKPSRVTWVALMAGLGGASFGYLAQWFTNTIDWPLIVGGRPMHSALSYVPVAFESGILVGAGSIVFTLIVLFGFPRVSHPVFEVDAFRSASIDGFWLSVATAEDEVRGKALQAMRDLGASTVSVVEDPP